MYSKLHPKHAHRLEIAEEILYAYGEEIDDTENLVQILVALMVWAFENEVDFKDALTDAGRIFRKGR